jgi:site-specific recombinase XerD
LLAWLRTERHNSPSTCNQRLAAISSYFRWMQTQDPARMVCCQDILAIHSSKHDQPAIAHLTVEQTRLLLALPDRSTRQGRRDATLLATLYDTAARVQETADLTVRDIRLEDPPIVALTGKGRKTRHVPIDANTAALLAAYLAERRLDTPGRDDRPVFFNQHHAKLTGGDLVVSQPVGGHQHHLRPRHLPIRQRIRTRQRLQHYALLIRQLNPERSVPRHQRPFTRGQDATHATTVLGR